MNREEILAVLARPGSGEKRKVTSTTNIAIKAMRALELKKNRAATDLFIAEGARAGLEAIAHGALPLVLAHLDEAGGEDHIARLVKTTLQAGGLVLEVNRDVLGKLSRRDNPQSVICVYRQRWHELSTFGTTATDRLLALETIRDPGNLGTILRTADGFDIRDILLIGEVTDPFAQEAVRASMGSIFAVRLHRATLDDFLTWRQGFTGLVVGTHLSAAHDIRTLAWKNPSLIVMGNEQQGLSAQMSEACDVLTKIPMGGRADSFNLAIATAITLYESRR